MEGEGAEVVVGWVVHGAGICCGHKSQQGARAIPTNGASYMHMEWLTQAAAAALLRVVTHGREAWGTQVPGAFDIARSSKQRCSPAARGFRRTSEL